MTSLKLKSCLGAELPLAMETRPELSPKCHKVNVSCQDRHWAKQGLLGTSAAMQHSRLEWKIQSFSVQTLTAVSSHRCLGLFKAREHRLVSGCIVAITDDSLRQGEQAPQSPACRQIAGIDGRSGTCRTDRTPPFQLFLCKTGAGF